MDLTKVTNLEESKYLSEMTFPCAMDAKAGYWINASNGEYEFINSEEGETVHKEGSLCWRDISDTYPAYYYNKISKEPLIKYTKSIRYGYLSKNFNVGEIYAKCLESTPTKTKKSKYITQESYTIDHLTVEIFRDNIQPLSTPRIEIYKDWKLIIKGGIIRDNEEWGYVFQEDIPFF